MVILTLSAVFMVKQHNEKILEIANYSDIIVGNNDEYEELGESQGLEVKTTLERVVKKFKNKEKLFIMTSGNKGVFVAKAPILVQIVRCALAFEVCHS